MRIGSNESLAMEIIALVQSRMHRSRSGRYTHLVRAVHSGEPFSSAVGGNAL